MFLSIWQGVLSFTARRPSRRRGTSRGRLLVCGQPLEERRLLAVVSMTDQEQLLLELINRARANPVAEAQRYGIDLNEELDPNEISPDPKQPLAPNQMLITAARRHSDDMLVREFFAHENPDGEDPTDRAKAAGYPKPAGENIAWYGVSGLLDRDGEVPRRHEALFLSPEHRTNMLYWAYREVGNGIRFGEFQRANAIMVTENFGNRATDYFITGVAYTDAKVPDAFYTIGESLPGIEITAVRQEDGATFSTTTGPSGGYSLPVPLGIYQVTGRGTGLSQPIVVQDVVISRANTKVDFNARASGLGTIGGVLFDDQDRDGQRDSGEGVLADWEVYLDADDNGQLDPGETVATTDSSGVYRFTNLRAGEYLLGLNLPPGWIGTTTSDEPRSVTLATAEVTLSNHLGAVLDNEPPVARPDSFTTTVGKALSMDVFANDEDPDGQLVLTQTRIRTAPAHGEVALNTTTGMLIYTPASGYVGTDFFEYAVVDDGELESAAARVTVTINPPVGTAWQNPQDRLDVNADDFVSSIDALLILNVINRQGAGPLELPTAQQQPPPFLDVTGDGFLSPLDALLVLNEVNRIAAERRGEGEPTPMATFASAARQSNRSIAAAVDALFERDDDA